MFNKGKLVLGSLAMAVALGLTAAPTALYAQQTSEDEWSDPRDWFDGDNVDTYQEPAPEFDDYYDNNYDFDDYSDYDDYDLYDDRYDYSQNDVYDPTVRFDTPDYRYGEEYASGYGYDYDYDYDYGDGLWDGDFDYYTNDWYDDNNDFMEWYD